MSRLGSLPPRDLERLSAYLDGDLVAREAEDIKARLGREPELRQALDELQQVVSAVRALPEVRVPRNFTLRAADVTRPASRAFSYLRFATVLATILFMFTTGLRTLSSMSFALGAAAPAQLQAAAEPERFRDNAAIAEPTSEAPAAQEAEVAPAAEPATEAPAGMMAAAPTQGPAGTSSPAPTMTATAPSLAYGAETGALDLAAESDEVAIDDDLRASQVVPAFSPLAAAQWALGLGALLLLALTVRSRRRR